MSDSKDVTSGNLLADTSQTNKKQARPHLEQTSGQRNNPLHGLSLKTIVTELQEHYGWQGLANKTRMNCFKSNPSIKSSLTFLRKTPWAREKIEQLYLFTQRDISRKRRKATTTTAGR